ncbi:MULTISPECIES: helix-turn-helix domain-containing protein [Rhodomicrobium]|uniref:helix-turn-helix domain-containing protein n=1 Tax=Rhodomicrobium TaxID=1068 RepID=UPI000B4AE36F|nr:MULTISPECIES: helix-turn-helix domain-containing protein [Rhodomicrobium]
MRTSNEFCLASTPDFETWRVEARPANGARSQYAEYDDIKASMRYLNLYGLPAVDLATPSVSSAKRTRSDAVRDGMTDFKLLFQLSGRCTLIQDERTSVLAAGDLGLVDATRPILAVPAEGPGRVIGLHLPRRPLTAHLGFEPQGGLRWKSDDALPARLLKSLVEGAIEDPDAASGDAQTFMERAIYNLVGALFGAGDLPQHFSQGDKLFLRICRIIKREFADPGFGPADIAAEAGISVRYLQKLFAMRGTTFGNHLRSCRLDYAASLLDGRAEMKSKPPLVEVARACGYRDYAHFARNFLARFGHTPGAFNTRVRAP